ncbi:hypothetical protein [Pedobacter frigoris]|uniref:hypothetical protein n=1 Tax=Pedobacter frigoris TaxID=2571272 RepID=UPI00292DCEDD|nr:hypothetical protein [Pedobacter frigoris]
MDIKNKFGTKVDPNMRDYSKDPYFVKKAEEAKVFLEKAGLPADLLKIQAERLKK